MSRSALGALNFSSHDLQELLRTYPDNWHGPFAKLGHKLWELREKAGLSQDKASNESISSSKKAEQIQKIEFGNELPNRELLLSLASVYGCNEQEIIQLLTIWQSYEDHPGRILVSSRRALGLTQDAAARRLRMRGGDFRAAERGEGPHDPLLLAKALQDRSVDPPPKDLVDQLNYADRLRRLRQGVPLSRARFAKRLGMTPDHVSEIERGNRLPADSDLNSLLSSLKASQKERYELRWLIGMMLRIATSQRQAETRPTNGTTFTYALPNIDLTSQLPFQKAAMDQLRWQVAAKSTIARRAGFTHVAHMLEDEGTHFVLIPVESVGQLANIVQTVPESHFLGTPGINFLVTSTAVTPSLASTLEVEREGVRHLIRREKVVRLGHRQRATKIARLRSRAIPFSAISHLYGRLPTAPKSLEPHLDMIGVERLYNYARRTR